MTMSTGKCLFCYIGWDKVLCGNMFNTNTPAHHQAFVLSLHQPKLWIGCCSPPVISFLLLFNFTYHILYFFGNHGGGMVW